MKIKFDLDCPDDRARVLELLGGAPQHEAMPDGTSFMELRIRNAPLSTRIKVVCRAEGIKTISDLCKLSSRHLERFPNLGQKSISDLKDYLMSYGVTLSPFRVKYND